MDAPLPTPPSPEPKQAGSSPSALPTQPSKPLLQSPTKPLTTPSGQPTTPPNEPRPSRRGFFGSLLRHALAPLAEQIEQKLDVIDQTTRRLTRPPPPSGPQRLDGLAADEASSTFGQVPGGAAAAAASTAPLAGRALLRPPGALVEEQFVSVCQRCNRCVEVCPVKAIVPTDSADPAVAGTPRILPDIQPCAVCADLACMPACPSGALVPINLFEIRMGIAVVNQSVCVRSAGEPCQACIDVCPLGERAILLEDDRVSVRTGCIGCGLCQNRCPTEPKAIFVRPL